MMAMGEKWAQLSSTIAGIMFAWAMFQQYFPHHLRSCIEKYAQKIITLFYPYIQINFHEFTGERLKRSEAFSAIEAYLMANSSKRAKRLKAEFGKNAKNLVLSMDDNEEIIDEFHGAKLWWAFNTSVRQNSSMNFSFYPTTDEKRYYRLTFHKKNREMVTNLYINHVIEEGKAVGIRNRQRRLYTNNPSDNWWGKSSKWSHVTFDHPAKFETIAMEPKKKMEIINDLITFRSGKEYYERIGKAWKRGYLLYGPPGTGKSTMIVAMANLLDYDVYDLELTTVKNNTELRRLLIDTSSKSIIVIEDIDCSLDLTGKRKKKKEKEEDGDEAKKDPIKEKDEKLNESSKVTLSGLLNFIDGLWSACGGERIIIFTTNYIEKLDPALIRRGRMDKHIEMGYCKFEGFKVLAKNYLKLEKHNLFEKIRVLMEDIDMTPADVAENLMPKTVDGDAEFCLENLIQALEMAKEEAKLKAEDEKAKKKSEDSKPQKEEKESELS